MEEIADVKEEFLLELKYNLSSSTDCFYFQYAISVYVVDSEEDISISFSYWDSTLPPSVIQQVSDALPSALDILLESSG